MPRKPPPSTQLELDAVLAGLGAPRVAAAKLPLPGQDRYRWDASEALAEYVRWADEARVRDLVPPPPKVRSSDAWKDVALLPRRQAARLQSSWGQSGCEQILRTAARAYDLRIGKAAARPGKAVVGGRTALLASAWPRCRRCKALLSHCFRMPVAALLPLFPLRDRSGVLSLFFCFECSSRDGARVLRVNEASAHMIEEPRARADTPGRSFTLRPRWSFPSRDSLRLAHRGTKTKHTFGCLDELLQDRYCEEFPTPSTVGDCLGGYAAWDQSDLTPRCPVCKRAMWHLFSLNGDMFLDGGARAFLCARTAKCRGMDDVRCVVEQ